VTVDITGVANVVRRLDESSTLQSFFAALALLYVAFSLATVGVMLWGLHQSESLDERELWLTLAAGTLASLAPLSFMAFDWIARKRWRHLAAIVGAAIGGLGAGAVMVGAAFALPLVPVPALIAAGLLLVVLTWLLAPSARIRRAALAFFVVAAALLALGWMADSVERSEEGLGRAAVRTLLLALTVAVGAWTVVRAVLVRIVLSGDRPRTLLLGELRRGGFWRRLALLSGLPSSHWNRGAFRTVSFWAFTCARPLVYLGAGLLTPDLLVLAAPAAQIPVGLAVLALGHALFHDAKYLASRAPWSPRERYEEPPILFLRSFADDQIEFSVPRWRLFRRWLQLWSFRRNADEALIDEMAQYGPVVALGRPGEKTPPYGAHRYYSTDEGWRETIADTARRAQAIVIGAGSTKGVLWEYELIARENLLEKTVLLFPPSQPAESHAALAAFVETAGLGAELRPPAGRALVAFLPRKSGPILLTAQAPSGAASLVALRAHFQRAGVADLADPASDFRSPGTEEPA
jgi:hypothetical protein